jgi:hypothetical protein
VRERSTRGRSRFRDVCPPRAPRARPLAEPPPGRTPHPLRDFTRAEPFTIGYGTLASTVGPTPRKLVITRQIRGVRRVGETRKQGDGKPSPYIRRQGARGAPALVELEIHDSSELAMDRLA